MSLKYMDAQVHVDNPLYVPLSLKLMGMSLVLQTTNFWIKILTWWWSWIWSQTWMEAMSVCTKFPGNPSNSHWDISALTANDDAPWKVGGAPKSLGFILLEPQNLMANHLVVVQTFQPAPKGCSDRYFHPAKHDRKHNWHSIEFNSKHTW